MARGGGGERDLGVAGYRPARLVEMRGLHREPEERSQARVEEVLAEVDVEVQLLLLLKLLDPAAHGRLVPVQGRGEHGVGRPPVPGELSQEQVVVGVQGHRLDFYVLRGQRVA